MDVNTTKQKELFVSNTLGTTPTEVFTVGTTPILSCLLYALFKTQYNLNRNGSIVHDVLVFVLEFSILVLLPFLSVTLLSNSVVQTNILLLIVALRILYPHMKQIKNSFQTITLREHFYLTNYKAQIQICTSICILAVDFDLFPRRFAKAEVYGVGIMDMAVGTIIFSNALTSSQCRLKSRLTFQSILRNLQSSSWLIGLGMLRVVLVKGARYQEHVTEYGVHWNFFFTLALVKPFCTFILFLLPRLQTQLCFLLISIFLIIAYQIALSKYGLVDIIQNGINADESRTTFLDANREGIFSSIGYCSIYFAGLFFGKQLFKESAKLHTQVLWLLLWSLSSWLTMQLSIMYVTQISRQMCNVSYYLLQMSCNCYLLSGYMIIDVVGGCFYADKQKKFDKHDGILYLSVSTICRGINRNQLIYFLLANVGTGLVNVLFNTLSVTAEFSILLTVGYLLVLNGLLWLLFSFQLKTF